MASIQTEREDKYDVPSDFVLPSLTDLIPKGGAIEISEVELISSYFDTPDLDLLRRGITLRRRRGDTDTGWHVKVPADKARTEIRLPLGSGEDAQVPEELASVLAGVALGKPLVPVATLTSKRRRHVFTASDGSVLAELADDSVDVQAEGIPDHRWRELEVELGAAGSEATLKRFGKALLTAGAQCGAHPSKLHRALAVNLEKKLGVLATYLDEQAQAIFAGDVYLRRGLDPIHSTRVAIRRYRSTLRVFGALFDEGAASILDSELAWYAGLLGEVRDRQVLRARLSDAVHKLPPELVLGPVAARIENDLLAEQVRHRGIIATELDGDRYRALLTSLGNLSRAFPAAVGAEDVDADELDRLARKAGRKVRRRVAAAVAGGDDVALHGARKAGKRARYAAELIFPIVGKKDATARIERYKAVQEVLGEHQDAVVASQKLLELGRKAGVTPGENGFTFGVLYAQEVAAAEAARAEVSKIDV
ncbi:CYTH and CHAD domain-containing protein [Rhodococcus sp. PAMC28707]|uniref:CYTH and CHAD domain-containing protein n=1 Tax=unclassified Rhodococcus (in: high G+C Gram-positive bacteria) TaxID=192944 RepID=UPI00109D9B15|nr:MULTISPECIES: CYTH and CHAD domain-containing protein [unclassified Rhodococcus (in: high G+C Gram-positive bacteria)]QCB49841.1 CYTH and CHAD domain-containing protein [Rhodococcus sp. PAMC28705]QCB58466.1 CYTH and CHAD domain-containing protein [Rhodococcus sp. PAMC28707]